MFPWSRSSPPREDPSVPAVEQLLDAAAARGSGAAPARDGRAVVTHALWICACVTLEDAPTWLIHDLHDGLAWRRVPDTVEPLDLVDARLTAATRTPRRCCAGCRALHPILGLAAATAAATRSCCRSCSGRSVPNEQAAADCGGTGRQERSRVVVFSCQPSSARMASSRQRGRCWRSAHSGPGPLEPVLTEARRASTGPDRFAQFDGRT